MASICDSNRYVFLEDQENLEEIEKRRNFNDSVLFDSSFEFNSSNKSNVTVVIAQVKTASQNISFLKFIFFLVYCNPFVKFLLNMFYKYCFDLPKECQLHKIFTKRERNIIKLITIISLVLNNFLFIFTDLFSEYNLKICLLFVNNLYLLYFVTGFYSDYEFRKIKREIYVRG